MSEKKAESHSEASDEFMRIELKVSEKLVEEVARLANLQHVPVGRMAAMLLAKALKMPEGEALPPYRPAGRPSKKAVNGYDKTNGHRKVTVSA